MIRRMRFLSVFVAVSSVLVAGCGEDDDLPEAPSDQEGSEVVPGEEGPVD